MGTRYIAFLRAINVGGRTVTMTELRKIFEAARFSDVETFIASGNVVFSSGAKNRARLEMQIGTALQKALGYSVATMLRTTAEVAEVAEQPAFAPGEVGTASLYVGFLQGEPARDAVTRALAMRTDIDDLRVQKREIYWLARKNIQESSITGAALERALGTPVTFRNINTVRRLAKKYAVSD